MIHKINSSKIIDFLTHLDFVHFIRNASLQNNFAIYSETEIN